MAIRFLATNLWEDITPTASSAATGFPVTNTTTRHFLEHWRSTGLTAEWVKADLGSDTVIRAIGIDFTNLRVGDSLNLQGQTEANGDDWDGDPALTINVSVTITAEMEERGFVLYNWEAAPTAVRYIRILLTATAHPDGYIRIGHIFAGSFVELDRDYDKDFEIEDVDPSGIIVSATNQKYVNILPTYKRIHLNFSAMSAADAAKVEAIRDLVGKKYTFHVELDPTGDLIGSSFYVSCVSGWRIRHIYGAQTYSMPLTLEQES